jgi:hypothetical protein
MNIKKFSQFISENLSMNESLDWAEMRRQILSLKGKEIDDIEEILPGFELDNQEGDEEFAYYDLVSPVDSKNISHVVAKITVEDGKITNINSMDDEEIEDYLTNKK